MIERIESNADCRGYSISEIGGRSENQDAVGSRETPLGLVVVVCDGMGGMKGGSTASTLAVKTILEQMEESVSVETEPEDAMRAALIEANHRVFEEGKDNPDLSGMGTTVTALLLNPNYAVAAFVGDSRIYQFRNRKKVFRTNDHSMVFQMVTAGIITEEQARLSAQSNIILQALGLSETIEPELFRLPYLKGDRFLLCTDGFWGMMPEAPLIKAVTDNAPLREVLKNTADRVSALGISRGGNHDNFSAAMIDSNVDSLAKPPMSKRTKILLLVFLALLVASLACNIIMLRKIQNLKAQVETTVSSEESLEDIPEDDTIVISEE